jgi:outer membrane protein OmpU
MRKVLFATTALVALGGVSAASADISVSASSSFNYVTTNGGAEAAEDRDVNTQVDVSISAARSLDNGMDVTAFIGLDEADSGQSADGDDAGMTISGDFGTVSMGGAASATLGAMSTDVTADEGWDLHANYIDPANEHVPHMDVSVALPPISNLNVVVGMVDGDTVGANEGDGDGSGFGLTYSTSGGMPVTLNYASYSTGAANSEVNSVGISVTAGAATVKAAANETGNYTGTSVGATYTVNSNLSIAAYTGTGEDSTNTNYEAEMTGMGLTYTITDGLSVSITHNDFTGKGDATAGTQTGSRTALAVDVSF